MKRIVVITLLTLLSSPLIARDLGQWSNADPTIREWYEHLMMPDLPQVSCCGEADAYWADSYDSKDGEYIAIITDERPDGPLKRPHVDVGTKIPIPKNKLKYDQSNPTGHGIVFMRKIIGGDPYIVYCYVAPGGV